MLTVTPYLFFDGRCNEALDFYHKCFGGVVLSKQLFSDAPQVIEGAQPDWIMHAEFEAFGMKLMMSDGVKGYGNTKHFQRHCPTARMPLTTAAAMRRMMYQSRRPIRLSSWPSSDDDESTWD